MQFGERANGGEVVGRDGDHALELGPGLVESVERLQRAAERHTSGQIRRVTLETREAHRDCVVEAARSPVLLGERAKCDGRRILLDPALELVDAGHVGPRPLRCGRQDGD